MVMIKDKIELMIGCDPEFWVSADGENPVSAHGLIPGTKKEPHKVKGGAVQVDGMALEFNINPASEYKEFTKNIDTVLGEMRKLTPLHSYIFKPVAQFGKKYIEQQPEEAKVLGCEPDFNAYTKAANPVPDGSGSFRTASGHVHISWKDHGNKNWPKDHIDPFDPTHLEACYALVKTLDAYLGLASIAWDRDTTRRSLYGKAGCFRPKSYGNGWIGLEYRVLGNSWVVVPEVTNTKTGEVISSEVMTDATRKTVFNNTVAAFTALIDNWGIQDKKYSGKTAQELIDSNNPAEIGKAIAREFDRGTILSPKHYREGK